MSAFSCSHLSSSRLESMALGATVHPQVQRFLDEQKTVVQTHGLSKENWTHADWCRLAAKTTLTVVQYAFAKQVDVIKQFCLIEMNQPKYHHQFYYLARSAPKNIGQIQEQLNANSRDWGWGDRPCHFKVVRDYLSFTIPTHDSSECKAAIYHIYKMAKDNKNNGWQFIITGSENETTLIYVYWPNIGIIEFQVVYPFDQNKFASDWESREPSKYNSTIEQLY